MSRFLCECKFLILWDKCPEVQLLGFMVVACLVFKTTTTIKNLQLLFKNSCVILHSQQQCVSDGVSSLPHQNLVVLLFIY